MMATGPTATWFETRGGVALLTMRIEDLGERRKDLSLRENSDLILRSIAKRCVSKDEAAAGEFSTSSSRRTPGPITTDVSGCAKAVEQRLSQQASRRMGPGVRRDDGMAENAGIHLRGIAWQP
jgi:hypothetical protein